MPILAERYQLADLVYSDSWVVAYRARDQLLKRYVTVELLRPERAEPGIDERLLAKGRRAALTSLPHVAAIYDQGVIDGRPFLVLEEPLGPALADALPLSSAAAVALVESLAQTQRSAMRRHQTIPALTAWTIRLSGDGRVQVMDLGLDQKPPTDDVAVRQLGRLLETALGPGSRDTVLLEIAARAESGSIAGMDALLDELRSVRHAPKTTEIMPHARTEQRAVNAPKPQVPAVPTRAHKPTSARLYAAADAPTAAVRRAPGTGRSSGFMVSAGLLVALLVAIGAALASGLPETTVDLPGVPTGQPAQQASPAAEPGASLPAPASTAAASPATDLGGVSPSGTSSAAPAAETFVVNANTVPPQVRLREGPGTNYLRIGALPNGTVVRIIDVPVEDGQYTWVKVRADDGTEGWCIREALRRNDER